MISYGGDYNPEQWSPEVWAEDDVLMRRAKVNTATVGVFSWSLLEPSEGEFSFGWLDDTLDRLHANGVRVNLATPTASPPPWFSLAYPDALPVWPDGSRLWHGSRDTYCAAAPAYREAALRIAGELARRYADHPALALWHVHNEYGTLCWCDHAASAFRAWLHARHGSLDSLNDAWGTAFWSQRYSAWEQIMPPRATQYLANPGQELDWRRFWSSELLAAFTEQRDVLRAANPSVPVTTNFMGPENLVLDPWQWGREVDVVAVDHYLSSMSASEGHADIAFVSDWARGIGGGKPWRLMEQAPGAVLYAGSVPEYREPGRMLADSLGYVARGSDSSLFFQWRASRAGAERFHPAMVPHAGPDSRTFAETVELGAALERIGPVAGSAVAGRDVALVVDADSRWALESAGMPSPHVRHLKVARAVHGALWRTGLDCDVVGVTCSAADLSRYRLVILPAVFVLSSAAADAVSAFVRGGGHLVVTFCSGVADTAARVYTGGYPGALRDVLGVRVEEFRPLAPDRTAALCDGTELSLWSERLRSEGARVLARYADGALAGLPAITHHRFGSGVAWYLSSLPSDDTLAALLRTVAGQAGVSPSLAGVAPSLTDASPDVRLSRRRDDAGRSWLFAFNLGDTPATLPATGTDLLTGHEVTGSLELAPGGAAVLREHGPRSGITGEGA